MRELSVLPGRVRFKCNRTYFDRKLAKYIDMYAEGLYGVEYSRVNHNLGTILILYDEAKTNPKLIKSSIEQVLTSEIDYDSEIFKNYDSYYSTKRKREFVKNNFMRSIFVYLFFKIKQLVFGKFFLSGSLAMVEAASLVAVIGGYSLLRNAYNRFTRRLYPHPDVFLKLISLILTISRESTEGLFLILLIDFTDYIKASADLKCQCLLKKSIVKPPNTAWIVTGDNNEMLTSIKSLEVGDTVLVHEGEVVPVYGRVLEGKAVVNNLYYTGQPLASLVEKGSEIHEGIIVMSGELRIHVLRLPEPLEKEDISIDKMHLREKIVKHEERMLPAAVILSTLNYIFTGDVLNALSIVLVMCPASSELAFSTAVKNYIHLLSKYNIYVKNPNTFEKIVNLDGIIFDKTGTLTYRDMNIAHVESFGDNYGNEDLLKICAACESINCKKISDDSCKPERKTNFSDAKKELENMILVPSKGIGINYDGHKVLIGDGDFLRENNVALDNIFERHLNYRENLYSFIFISVDGRAVGMIVMEENIRKGACSLIGRLKANGIGNISIVTGDSLEKGRYVADKLGIKDVYGGCNSGEKLQILLEQKSKGPVMMVGDGVNDILSMRAADVSVSFLDYSSNEIKLNSDYIIFDDDVNRLEDLIMLSQSAYEIMQQNIKMSNLFNISLGIFAFLGGLDVFAAKSINTINSILTLIMNERVTLIPK